MVQNTSITMEAIRQQHRSTGKLWEDPDFPAVDSSLFFSKKPPRPFLWQRPNDIIAKPEMVVADASRFDVTQGMLGDAWLLAPIGSLAMYSQLFEAVVPGGQSLNGSDYCGAIQFNFWQEGEWIEVIVDDRLPTYNNKLVFLHSATTNEFWSALLEKAYAKLHGSYESLKSGQSAEAMEDFTGGIAEPINLQKAPDNLFDIMLQAEQRQSLMNCSIEAKPNEIEAKLNNGLIKGHPYSVTKVTRVDVPTRSGSTAIELVRVRNPWGNEREWTGAWSDNSREWRLIADDDKQALDLTYDDDGEFWMSFRDFQANFTQLEICQLTSESLGAIAGDKRASSWVTHSFTGQWQRHTTAGGCRNFPNTFHTNPQFRVTLKGANNEGLCPLIIALMQTGRRSLKRAGVQNLTIGFAIYKLDGNETFTGNAPKEFFLRNRSVARSNNFVASRENVGRFALPPGEYLIVPSTFTAGETGDFLLRLFTGPATTVAGTDGQASKSSTTIQRSTASVQIPAKFKEFFDKVASKDGLLDADELNNVLSSAFKRESGGKEFGKAVARGLIELFDQDGSGKMSIEEFSSLWTTLSLWKTAFKQHDVDGSQSINAVELRTVLNTLGFKVSTDVIFKMVAKYSTKDNTILFPEYVLCMANLQRAFDTFTPNAGPDLMRIDIETWINHTI